MNQPTASTSPLKPGWFKVKPSPRLIAVVLFVVALAPRLPGLSRFLTSDENTNIFFAGSDVIVAFLQGNFRGTYWHFYPGVTMSWLDTAGMAGQYLLQWVSGAALPPFTDYIYSDILTLLVANRLPYAILTAVTIPALYWLARQLLPGSVALLGALFLAFDPFFLAHSRVAHGDAPVAVFMSLSALAFFSYARQMGQAAPPSAKLAAFGWIVRHPKARYLIASAILGSLAALTKAPGQFMALFVVGVAVIYLGLAWRQATSGRSSGSYLLQSVVNWLMVVAWWGIISLAAFGLLWPAMWVDPIGTIQRMLHETVVKVDEGHLVYFWGQPTLDPGPWFYPYVILFRLTPITFIGLGLSLALPIWPANSQKLDRSGVYWLWFFTITLLVFGTLSPKKQDRYLLVLFPFLDLLAAVGWLGLLGLIQENRFALKAPLLRTTDHALRGGAWSVVRSTLAQNSASFYTLILLLLHSLPLITYYPYYLTYFNPLFGGPERAARTTLMGWGEGMEQAAAYLNTKPNASQLYVASTPSQTLLPYFAGTGENFYTNDVAFRADYVVLYLAQMQRLAPSPEIVRYFEAQLPEKVITIHGVAYAKIYPGPKLILNDIPPTATPINLGLGDTLRLAGYHYQALTAKPTVTLYWHALAPLTVNYTISVRAWSADERLLAQKDSWPVNGLLPTSQWRQGDYVSDAYALEIPPSEMPKLHHFELVVYNAVSAETLGSPIILPLSDQP